MPKSMDSGKEIIPAQENEPRQAATQEDIPMDAYLDPQDIQNEPTVEDEPIAAAEPKAEEKSELGEEMEAALAIAERIRGDEDLDIPTFLRDKPKDIPLD